jgi:protease-4
MEKVGVKTQTIKAGKYKQIGTMDREWTEYEKEELDKVVQGTYNLFLNDVIEARGLDINDSDKFANAKVFIASQAKEVNLIDEIGVEYDAKNILKTLSGVDEAIWNREDKLDKLINKLTTQGISTINTYFPQIILK